MFETDAEEYIKEHTFFDEEYGVQSLDVASKTIFKDGAEFGYNKANEWHYVKDGLPKEMQEVIICIKDEKRITRAKRIKNDLWTSPSEDFNTQEIIAWKELPELPKESE